MRAEKNCALPWGSIPVSVLPKTIDHLSNAVQTTMYVKSPVPKIIITRLKSTQMSEDSSVGYCTIFSFSHFPAGAGEESHLRGVCPTLLAVGPSLSPEPHGAWGSAMG